MLPPSFGLKEPQRVCQICYGKLRPFQDKLISFNTNSARTNEIEEDGVTRYLNSPIRFTLGGEVRKGAYSIQNLIDGFETALDDGHLSEDLLRDAEALMFMTCTKAAFVWGFRFGTGLVIRRLRTGQSKWSAPCAILMAGLTMGAQVGAEVTDMVIPLHETEAIEHFSVPGGTHLMLGGETGLAFGPMGRSGEASVMASARGKDTCTHHITKPKMFISAHTPQNVWSCLQARARTHTYTLTLLQPLLINRHGCNHVVLTQSRLVRWHVSGGSICYCAGRREHALLRP